MCVNYWAFMRENNWEPNLRTISQEILKISYIYTYTLICVWKLMIYYYRRIPQEPISYMLESPRWITNYYFVGNQIYYYITISLTKMVLKLLSRWYPREIPIKSQIFGKWHKMDMLIPSVYNTYIYIYINIYIYIQRIRMWTYNSCICLVKSLSATTLDTEQTRGILDFL